MENKDLLYEDITSRLLYSVKACHKDNEKQSGYIVGVVGDNVMIGSSGFASFNINDVRPYLFPLTNITDEQKKELDKKFNVIWIGLKNIHIHYHSEGYWDTDLELDLSDWLWVISWFNKNHFDYRGLIEKGLAIDATDKGIY